MTWPQYILLAYLAWGAIVTIGLVGKEREPITPSLAVATAIASGLLAWLVVLA